MKKRSNARIFHSYARFFLDKAELSRTAERETFEAYLSAAIVFGRSVTLQIQKEYKHRAGFDDWYSVHQKWMDDDPVCQFFLRARNLILKQGPVGVKRIWDLSGSVIITSATLPAELRVIRGKPWYRWSLKEIWEDLRAELIRPFCKLRRRRKIARKHVQSDLDSSRHVTKAQGFYYFDAPAYETRPALELLGEYLDKLETIVDDAEWQFEVGST